MQYCLKGIKFQTGNGEFNIEAHKDLVATSGGLFISKCPYSPETMSIIKRSWRTTGEMTTVMLLHCGMAGNFCGKVTLYSLIVFLLIVFLIIVFHL